MNALNLIHMLCLLEFASQIVGSYVNELSYLCKTLFGRAKQILEGQVENPNAHLNRTITLKIARDKLTDIYIFYILLWCTSAIMPFSLMLYYPMQSFSNAW